MKYLLKVFNESGVRQAISRSTVHLAQVMGRPNLNTARTLCGRPLRDYPRTSTSDGLEVTCKTCVTRLAAMPKEAT